MSDDPDAQKKLREAELEGQHDFALLRLRRKSDLSLDGDYFLCSCGAKTWQDRPEREEFRGDLYCNQCGVLMPFEDLKKQLSEKFTDD